MKSIYILFFLVFIYYGSCKSSAPSLEKALNPDSNPNCLGDCQALKKIQGIFPLRGDQKNIDTQLNLFNWKYFYIFSDHVSVYAASQKENAVVF